MYHMAVRYVKFEGKTCSYEWWVFLTAARAAEVAFSANSLRRTMAEQQALYNQNMSGGRPRPGRPLTAWPSENAPHIRVGRWDHAGDFEGAQALIAFGRKNGVTLALTVAGESWHLEFQSVSAAWLIQLFAKPDYYSFLQDREARLIKTSLGIRADARKRGKWLVAETARVKSIEVYLRAKVAGLKRKKRLTERERKRLGYLRDGIAGRTLK